MEQPESPLVHPPALAGNVASLAVDCVTGAPSPCTCNNRESLKCKKNCVNAPQHNPPDWEDAARFRFLCARPHWGFIEEICLQFAAESETEFRQKLRAEIDRRMALAPHPFGEGARNE